MLAAVSLAPALCSRVVTLKKIGLLSQLLLCAPGVASADPAAWLLRLASIPGTAGHETAVREAVERAMPASARPRTDNLGNITLRLGGSASPHLLIVAPLDEPGVVISSIRDDGYLRVHRHTPAAGHRLAAQFFVGQPVLIKTSAGTFVPGVTATPSTHLRAFRDPADVARIQTEDDVWIDVGASSRVEATALGIRELDSVTLRERATALAGGRVAGVAASHRAAAVALVEALRRQASPVERPASVSMAWVAQSQFGNRGLLRLLESLKPDRLVVLRGGVAPADDAQGSVGALGRGVVIAEGDTYLSQATTSAQVELQTIAAERLRIPLGDAFKALPVHVVATPVLFAQTPVETVDGRDVEAMARLVAALASLGPLREDKDDVGDLPDPMPMALSKPQGVAGQGFSVGRDWETFRAVAEPYGVSGHEAPVREAILKQLPAWAKPEVDARGNISVTVGAGGRPLAFLAHMDEVGFEITSIGDDGSMALRGRGGMYLSLYEAQPVLIHAARPVNAVLAPRRGYAKAATSQPALEDLVAYAGTTSAAETRALGISEGQSLTVRKRLVQLAGTRASVRAMDDRVGSTALILALRQIDPTTLANRVTFAWTVEEETGLAGAAYLAEHGLKVDTAFAVDTFVSSDSPVDPQRIGRGLLGAGAVLRGLDSRTLVRPETIDRISALAKAARIPLQVGITMGGTDASPFAAHGAVDVNLSWPGRYSHSPVEVMDTRDLDALVRLVVALARGY